MTRPAAMVAPPLPAEAGRRGSRVHAAAFVLLLAGVAARCFVAELPFHGSALQFLPDPSAGGVATRPVSAADNPSAYDVDRTELSRVAFAVLLLGAVALWAIGGVTAGRLTVRHGRLAAIAALLAAWSLIAAMAASNRRAALNGWLEQLALLAACFLAIQLCADRRRFALAVAVLVGVGATLAVKGFWQVGIEIPDRVADFDAHRLERLTEFGWAPGTPQARLIEARLRDNAITGFFSLANPFASLMVVPLLAAIGLAVDRVRAARRSRRAGREKRRPGEVDLPTIAAALTVAAAVMVAVAVVLTKSRGAILAGVLAVALLAAVLLLRTRIGPSWRRWFAGAVAAVALGGAGGVLYGLKNDRLPTTTMTFRWYYWTGSARLIADHPVLGVGPGNFAANYLRYRRDEAEEEIQMPHNAVVHALAQYGIPGGICYLAILGWLLVGCVRPRGPSQASPDEPPPAGLRTAVLLAAIVAAAVASRATLSLFQAGTGLYVLEVALPAAVLAAMLLLAAWSGRGLGELTGEPAQAVRAALACGVAGFLLHNMVTFSLWLPAPGGVLFLAAGACVAQGPPGRPRPLGGSRWLLAAAAVAAVAGAVILIGMPVLDKTRHTAGMLASLKDGDIPGAMKHARRASQADPLDPRPAADAAQVAVMHVSIPRYPLGLPLTRVLDLSDQATDRDRLNAQYWRLAGNIAWAVERQRDAHKARLLADGDRAWLAGRIDEARRLWARAWRRMKRMRPEYTMAKAGSDLRRAVELNPKDSRLRLNCASVHCNTNRPRICLRHVDEALRLDGKLLPGSVELLTAAERRQADLLRAHATFLLSLPEKPSTTGPTTAPAQQ